MVLDYTKSSFTYKIRPYHMKQLSETELEERRKKSKKAIDDLFNGIKTKDNEHLIAEPYQLTNPELKKVD
jgi:ABC-type Zn uptake system ZnuABC Zn-binding protein ZnuA